MVEVTRIHDTPFHTFLFPLFADVYKGFHLKVVTFAVISIVLNIASRNNRAVSAVCPGYAHRVAGVTRSCTPSCNQPVMFLGWETTSCRDYTWKLRLLTSSSWGQC